jgi:hypothetical protein
MLPGDTFYEDARRVWNAMIDRRPAVIVRCEEAADVPPAIAFARENGLEISVRGGGHHIAGHSVSDGGLMIDFAGMKNVQLDAAVPRVRPTWRHPWRFRPSRADAWAGHAGGDQLNYGYCRPHTRRWFRLVDAQVRHDCSTIWSPLT